MFIGHAAGFSLSVRPSVCFSPVSPARGDACRSVPFGRAAAPVPKPRSAGADSPGDAGDVSGRAGGTRARGLRAPGCPRGADGRWHCCTGQRRSPRCREPHAAAMGRGWMRPAGLDETHRAGETPRAGETLRAPRCSLSQCPPRHGSLAAHRAGRDRPCPRAAGDTAVMRMP